MKKLLTLLFAVALTFSLSSFAQDQASMDKKDDTKKADKKEKKAKKDKKKKKGEKKDEKAADQK